jgi:hypothetical protein
MKQKQIAPYLALTMSLELMLSPVLTYAQGSGTAQTINKALDAAGTIGGAVTNQLLNGGRNPLQGAGPMNPQAQSDMAALGAQQRPMPDKFFNPQLMQKMPGLNEYLALNNINPALLNCQTLPTTLTEVRNESCRMGATGSAPPQVQQAQMAEAYAYHNQYFQIQKLYSNYQAQTNNEGQLFGSGCMKNAMQILSGFFQYRTNELDKLTTNLEAIQNQFKEAARSDLDAIEESTAVLEGGGSELTNKVRSKRPDLFDFGKRFNNPACTSMLANDDFNKIGRDKGLNSINQVLKDTANEKPPGSKFSGDSYSKSHASVVSDIRKLADKVAKQVELGFSTLTENNQGYLSFLGGLPRAVSSENNTNQALRPELFADLQSRFAEKNAKLSTEMTEINSELRAAGVNGGRALGMVRNLNASNFDAEVSTIETEMKNSCLKRQVNIDGLISRLYDPNANKFANQVGANPLPEKIRQILENDKTSLKKKLDDIRSLEAQLGSRYFLKMDAPYEVQTVDANGEIQTKLVQPSVQKAPSAYISDMIGNCEAQFKVNALDNKMTGAGAVKRLRNLNQEYKKLAKEHAQDMRDEIRKKLIDCDSAEDANNTTPGSCTSARFNTSSPNFCAAAALSCSKNMQQCNQQAEKFVTDMKTERTARVNNYKNLMEKNKKDIVRIFDTALAKYMREGEIMRGSFGSGFSSPEGIQRDVADGDRYLSSFRQATGGSPDGALLLEDPDKFIVMFKNNIAKLKRSVEKQQQEIMGGGSGGGILAAHIQTTEKNLKTVESQAKTLADQCLASYENSAKAAEQATAQAQQEWQKKTGENNEKIQKFCRQYGIVANSPNPSCGNVEELSDAVLSAVNTDEARTAAVNMQTACVSFNNSSTSSSNVTIDAFCSNQAANDRSTQSGRTCDDYRRILTCQGEHTISDGCKDLARRVNQLSSEAEITSTSFDNAITKLESSATRLGTQGTVATSSQRSSAQAEMKKNGTPGFCNAQNGDWMQNVKSILGEQGGNPAMAGGAGTRRY